MTKKAIRTSPKIIPILFNTDMVRAILNGDKTQTRRIVKDEQLQTNKNQFSEEEFLLLTVKNKIRKNDILWVRETFGQILSFDTHCYKADCYDGEKPVLGWKPSIFMPKEACRLFLKVKSVRIERLNSISETDAIAEGITEYAYGYWRNYDSSFCGGRPKTGLDFKNAIESFKSLWESINGKESWQANPFVYVIEFEKVERPEGFI